MLQIPVSKPCTPQVQFTWVSSAWLTLQSQKEEQEESFAPLG